MKYIKKFENDKNEPSQYDWVCVKIDPSDFDWVKNIEKLVQFFSTNIGRVRKINYINDKYLVEFFPKNNEEIRILDRYSKDNGYDSSDPKNSYDFFLEEIEFFSSNREDVEAFINSKKYNL